MIFIYSFIRLILTDAHQCSMMFIDFRRVTLIIADLGGTPGTAHKRHTEHPGLLGQPSRKHALETLCMCFQQKSRDRPFRLHGSDPTLTVHDTYSCVFIVFRGSSILLASRKIRGSRAEDRGRPHAEEVHEYSRTGSP